MTELLTDFERSLFHSAWLAWNDLTQPNFLELFLPIWDDMVGKIEDFSRQCEFPVDLRKSRMAITVQSTESFAFSPVANGFMLNIFNLFFRNNGRAIYLNPLEYIVNSIVHEGNHRKYFLKHDMLGRDKDIKNFIKNNFFDYEANAVKAEINFMKNALKLLPLMSDERSYLINSWSDEGFPTCEVTAIGVCPKIRLEFLLKKRQALLVQIENLEKVSFPSIEFSEKSKTISSELNLGLLGSLNLGKPLSTVPFIELPL